MRHNPATGLHELLKGLDPAKDQSYFLHRLNQSQLSRTLFPVGELRKTEVRRIAEEIGLPNAKKKDSTGICFIGERPFREFLNRYIQHAPGPILDDRGRRLGQHVGLSFYTLGQRQGLGIGGVKDKGAQRGGGEHAPWFVARKEVERNVLRVVQGHDHPWLLSHTLQATDANWVAGRPPAAGACAAKTRYRQQDAACTVTQAEGGFRALISRSAVGGDAGAERGAVRRRGVPGRRGDHGGRAGEQRGIAQNVAPRPEGLSLGPFAGKIAFRGTAAL